MNWQPLARITNALGKVLRELTRQGFEDSRIAAPLAEYWVAHELCRQGFKAQILDEREVTSADVYLPDKKLRIEVKSAFFDGDGFACASFALGNQITKKKFDYCVFLTFAKAGGAKPKDVFIFSRDELKEIAIPRKRLAAHPDSNPCLLMYGHSLTKYRRQVKRWRIRAFEVEKQLHSTPRRFRNAWKKICKCDERTS